MSGINRLREHVEDCDDCRRVPPSLERIDSALASSRIEIDAAALSRQALAAAQPVLHAIAVRQFWRQVAAVVVLTLAPLPAILAYDTVLLRLLHAVVSALLPSTVATYIVFLYASS